MVETGRKYRALISSDWNECLAPCGPFDVIAYTYPHLDTELKNIFRPYTANQIPLGEAIAQTSKILPAPITVAQMDAYLEKSFTTYQGISDLIGWCLDENILFMINTTGMIGYFQRILAKHLLPGFPVLSANPMIRFSGTKSDPFVYDLFETSDKGKNTEAAAGKYGIPLNKIILIGDSGGDGPHFEWGNRVNASLIGSMTKPSLEQYCRDRNIVIDLRFGISYAPKETKSIEAEMQIDFKQLIDIISELLAC